MSADAIMDGTTFIKLIAVLVLVIGLILIAGWLFKRTGAGFQRAGSR